MYFDNDRVYSKGYDLMKGVYLGPHFSEKETITMNKRYRAFQKIEEFDKLSEKVAKIISDFVVRWPWKIQFGPRA